MKFAELLIFFHNFLSLLQNWKDQSSPEENVLRNTLPFLFFVVGLPSSVSIATPKLHTTDERPIEGRRGEGFLHFCKVAIGDVICVFRI